MATNFPINPVDGQTFVLRGTTYVYNLAIKSWTIASSSITSPTFLTLNLTGTDQSYSTTTGVLVVAGGVGIGGNVNIGNNLTVLGTSTFVSTSTFVGNSIFDSTIYAKKLQANGIGSTATISGNWSLTSGSTLQATYADLAECYQADANYEPGTVLAFGGEFEVTIAEDSTRRVAGIVSTDPAFLLNRELMGPNVIRLALQGRVPCKVRGKVEKGDMMIAAGGGFARASYTPILGSVIGKALEDFDGIEGVIEVVVGRL
jgi:hypothetical protein